jgi:hypothetical protein
LYERVCEQTKPLSKIPAIFQVPGKQFNSGQGVPEAFRISTSAQKRSTPTWLSKKIDNASGWNDIEADKADRSS